MNRQRPARPRCAARAARVLLAAVALLPVLAVGHASAAAKAGDIVFIIDESASMGPDIADVKNRIDGITAVLDPLFDDRYGLVAFAGAPPGQVPMEPFVRSNVVDPATFKTALGGAGAFSVPTGSEEWGLDAIRLGMQLSGFRAGAGVCVVLISDEAPSIRADEAAEMNAAKAALASRNAVFFGIVTTSSPRTQRTYGPNPGSLSETTGGAVFDIEAFRADAGPVLTEITNKCGKEILDRATAGAFTPIPTTGVAPLDVTFTATPGEAGSTYAWDFADGTPAGSGEAVTHTFTKPGDYRVTLTITGPSGASTAFATISVRGAGGAPPGSLETDCTILGTDANDTLTGTDRNDVICGRGGNDFIRGGKGNDAIVGGLGTDDLRGGAGNDRLSGGPGKDKLRGDGGDDTVLGEGAADRIGGGAGNDKLSGGSGPDNMNGGKGKDTINGDGQKDVIIAKDKTKDTVDGGRGGDRGIFDRIDVLARIP